MKAHAVPASAHEPPAFRITGRIPRRTVPLSYHAGLASVAFAMVLLPILYISLIVFVGIGMYWYAIHATVIFEGGGGGLMRVVVYIAPLFAGVVLIAFMIKPLVAQRATNSEALDLNMEAHPRLRALIDEICAAVGAPAPVVVEIDNNVNASARMRRGLWSLGQKDLTLRIGLPLIKGLTTRQLAGVLAHEFGHFSQRAGMALTYVIRSINDWFARVVYERDEWDETIQRRSQNGNGYIMVLFVCARGALWLTRHILRFFMIAGHAVSCLQLRQMEYDADYYEISLSGSETFVSTARELNRLNVAAQLTYGKLQELWQRRQAVDDVPGLILSSRGSLASDLLQKADAAQIEAETAWFHTHPSDRDRIAHAEALARPGVFDGDGPATELVNDLDEMCRLATAAFYEARGLTVNANAIVPAAALHESTQLTEAAKAAWQRLDADVVNLSRPIRWSAADFAMPASDAASVVAKLSELRRELARLRAQASKDEETYRGMLDHLAILENARRLLEQGIQVEPRQFRLAQSSLAEAQAEIAATKERLEARRTALKPYEHSLHLWVSLVGSAARGSAFRDRVPEELLNEIIVLTDGLVTHDACFRDFHEWIALHRYLTCLTSNRHDGPNSQSWATATHQARQQARALEDQTLKLLENVPSPFPTAELPTSAAALKRSLQGTFDEGRLVVLLRYVAHLYFESLTRITLRGEPLEAAFMPPLPESSSSRSRV